MRLSFSRVIEAALLSALAFLPRTAQAGLIFDLDPAHSRALLEYEVEGLAFAEFPNPDVEEIQVHWLGTAHGHGTAVFRDPAGVEVFFGFNGPIEDEWFELDYVAMIHVPAFGRNPYFVDLFADNFEGNSFAIGQVLVDTEELLVLRIDAGRHLNIPVLPDFSWGGTFTITVTGVPEPAITGLTAGGLIACAAWHSRRKRLRPRLPHRLNG